jgi:hypothetical protein
VEDAGKEVGAGFAAGMFVCVLCGSALTGIVHHFLDLFEELTGYGGGAVFFEDHVTIVQGADVDGVAEEGDVSIDK